MRESTRRITALDLHVVEAGEPGRPLLILLHGFPEFRWAWRHRITPFAQAGYRVVVPDMRGCDGSDAPQDVSAYMIDFLAADVVALADAFGAHRFDLVAHDRGAVIGWRVAARHADRLGRVVPMDGPHPDMWGRHALKHPTQALRTSNVAEAGLALCDNGVLEFVEGAGHWLHIEQPERIDARVLAWLREAG